MNTKNNNRLTDWIKTGYSTLVYLFFIVSSYYFCSLIGDFKVFDVYINAEKIRNIDYNNFIEFIIPHWQIVLCFLASSTLTFLSHFKLFGNTSKTLDQWLFGNSMAVQLLTVSSLILGIYAAVTSSSVLMWLAPDIDQVGVARYGVEYILFLSMIVFLSLVKNGAITARRTQDDDAERVAHFNNFETKQTKHVNELEKIISLAPPGKFPSQFAHYADLLEDFSSVKVLDSTMNFVNLPVEEKTTTAWVKVVEEQQNYIRTSLMAFARLASTYDNAASGYGSPLEYRANLMFKIKDPELLSIFKKGKRHKERYFLGLGSTPEYQLMLSKEYSVLIDSEDESLLATNFDEEQSSGYTVKKFLPDVSIEDAVFPVYYDAKGGHSSYNMFGAPEAVASCRPQFITNTKDNVENLYNLGMAKPIVDEAINDYANGKDGHSIISLPLSHQRFLATSLTPEDMSGVLNIYRNQTDIFSQDSDKFTDFSYLTLPLQISLSRIVHLHLMTLSEKSNCTTTEITDEDIGFEVESSTVEAKTESSDVKPEEAKTEKPEAKVKDESKKNITADKPADSAKDKSKSNKGKGKSSKVEGDVTV